jgi:hypothetical protein
LLLFSIRAGAGENPVAVGISAELLAAGTNSEAGQPGGMETYDE